MNLSAKFTFDDDEMTTDFLLSATQSLSNFDWELHMGLPNSFFLSQFGTFFEKAIIYLLTHVTCP